MLNAMIDFSQCNKFKCEIGGSEGTVPWKLYSSNPNGARTLLVAPINQISEESDTKLLIKRCSFFDRIIASKNDSQLVSIPFPDSFDVISDDKIRLDPMVKFLGFKLPFKFNFWKAED
jgi:hypothetical protein